jgi:hypothetical protein
MGSPSYIIEKKFGEGQKGDDITPFDGTYRKKSENKEATERLLIDNSCVTDP